MKSGKATGPEDIAEKLWKAKSRGSMNWLSEFFNQVIVEPDWLKGKQDHFNTEKERQPSCVQIIVRFDPCPITTKIFERILDNDIRNILQITVNQAGFVKNCGTADAVR